MFSLVHQFLHKAGSVMASSAAPADLQARVSPSAEAEHFVYFSLTRFSNGGGNPVGGAWLV